MIQSVWLRFFTGFLAISILLIFPQFGLLPMYAYAIIGLCICWFGLRLRGETYKDIGFRISGISLHSFLIGGGLGFLFAIANYWVIGPLIAWLTGFTELDVSGFLFIRYHFLDYIFMLVMGWLVGGIYEENVFRGYIFHTLHLLFPAGNTWYFVAALITSLLFGLYHIQQGMLGELNAIVFSMPIVYLQYRYNSNLWYCIFFHACFDTFGITLIRLGYLS